MYLRFLNNKDYLDVFTEKAFNQIVRTDENSEEEIDRLCSGAEMAAEASIREYLSEHYMIDKELNVGKYIAGYTDMINITYPAGVHIYYNGEIYQTLTAIMGTKKPINSDFWREMEYDEVDKTIEYEEYSQMETYKVGDMVCVGDMVFCAKRPNGVNIFDIRMPTVEGWEVCDISEWMFNEWEINSVVKCKGKLYELVSLLDIDYTVSPDMSDNWIEIKEYDSEKKYDIYDTAIYVSYDLGEVVVRAITNVNADKVKVGKNISKSDPRNFTIRAHMIKLAAYELSKQLSPNDVSVVRLRDYEESMKWLHRAGKLQISPAIERKRDDTGEHTMEWVVGKFSRSLSRDRHGWGAF